MNQHYFEKVREIIANYLIIANRDEIKPESNIFVDLGADSLDKIELVMKIEDEFDVEILDSELGVMITVESIVNIISKKKENA